MPKPLLPVSVSLFVLACLTAVPPVLAQQAAPAKHTAGPDPVLGQELFEQAIADTQAGKYADAQTLYRQLVKLFPNVAAAWANMGLLAARQNQLDEADTDLRRAVALDPGSAQFWAQVSSIELRRGNALEAEATARRTLAIDPANVYGLGNLAGALLRQGREAEALVPLKRLVAIQGTANPQASISLMATYAHMGRLHDALQIAVKLAGEFPKQPQYQQFVGDLSARSGDYVTARAAYGRAFKLHPTDVRSGIDAAIATEATGDPKAAAAQIARVIAANPNEAMAYYQQGRLYYTYPVLTGGPPANFVAAAASYRQAMLLDPKNPVYLRNLGLALTFEGGDENYDHAEKFFDAALYVDPKDTVAHMGLGYLYEQRRQIPDALAQYQAVLDYAPNSYDTRRRMAGLLYQSGKKDDAYAQFQALADVTPGAKGAVPLKEVASLQMSDHKYELARASYAAAAARDPKDPSAFVGMGQALEKLNRQADAEAAYRTALAAAPKDKTTLVALGDLLLAEHRLVDAARVYEQFVTDVPDDNAARWQLAQIYENQNRVDDALRVLRAMPIDNEDATHLSYVLAPSGLLMRHGRYPEAAADLTGLAAKYPITGTDGVEIRYALADVLDRSARSADAEKVVATLVSAASETAATVRARTALADIYKNESRWDDAGSQYEQVLTADPGSVPARFGLAFVRDKENKRDAAGDFIESLVFTDPKMPNLTAASAVSALYQQYQTPQRYLDFARRVADKYPQNHDALTLYANALYQRSAMIAPGTAEPTVDRLTKAAELYRRIAAIDPKDVDARYRLGSIDEKLGNKADAIVAYQEALTAAGTTKSSAATAARESLVRLGVIAQTAAPAAPPGAPAGTAPVLPSAPTADGPSAAPPIGPAVSADGKQAGSTQ